ncbi:Amidohydrolase 2 [Lachnospiraceae bacterium TWA4]|nr:Amidohydrolase 2 [Lachnospiraceae bacterium TWA4]
MIIDFHTHTFPDKISKQVVDKLAHASCTLPFTDGSTKNLISSMEEATVNYSVNLPVMTNAKQVEKIHNQTIESMEEYANHGIIPFGGMHPNYENYKEELRRIRKEGIKGIKIHPAYQEIDLDDIKMLRIIGAASEEGLIVITHAGIDIGIYDKNYASIDHILKVIDEVKPEKFVLAHMGNWAGWKDVEYYLAGAPVWFDTAFTYGKITPYPDTTPTPYTCVLEDDDFVRLSKKHGIDKILFGTDSPWQEQKDYVNRLNAMDFTEDEKGEILGENAKKLLGI